MNQNEKNVQVLNEQELEQVDGGFHMGTVIQDARKRKKPFGTLEQAPGRAGTVQTAVLRPDEAGAPQTLESGSGALGSHGGDCCAHDTQML